MLKTTEHAYYRNGIGNAKGMINDTILHILRSVRYTDHVIIIAYM